jgi:hypothetical protein
MQARTVSTPITDHISRIFVAFREDHLVGTELGKLHSAAFAVLPNIRLGAGKPQEVPSVILT